MLRRIDRGIAVARRPCRTTSRPRASIAVPRHPDRCWSQALRRPVRDSIAPMQNCFQRTDHVLQNLTNFPFPSRAQSTSNRCDGYRGNGPSVGPPDCSGNRLGSWHQTDVVDAVTSLSCVHDLVQRHRLRHPICAKSDLVLVDDLARFGERNRSEYGDAGTTDAQWAPGTDFNGQDLNWIGPDEPGNAQRIQAGPNREEDGIADLSRQAHEVRLGRYDKLGT